jgi:hypothetical protein
LVFHRPLSEAVSMQMSCVGIRSVRFIELQSLSAPYP